MIFLILLGLLLSFATGILYITLLWPDSPKPPVAYILGLGCGIGFSSIVGFFVVFFGQSTRIIYIFVDLLFLLIIVLVSIYFHKINLIFPAIPSPKIWGKAKLETSLLALFLILFIFSLLIIVASSIIKPHGDWDAWAIWNLHARFLFKDALNWQESFANSILGWTHPDYPLLLPVSIVRLWHYIGTTSLLVPIFLGVLFVVSTIGLLFFALQDLRGTFNAIIGGLMLLSAPFFIIQGSAQYADIPLAFFLLAAFVLFAKYEKNQTWQFLFLTGNVLGLLVWTKNEGVLILLCFLAAHFLISFRQKKGYLWELLTLIVGTLPVMVTLLVFKIGVAPANDLISVPGISQNLANIQNFSRYLVTADFFISSAFNIFQIPLVVLIVFLLLVGLNLDYVSRRFGFVFLLTTLFTFVGFFLIYIMTPYDLVWHLQTSLNRLFLQFWPTLVFMTLSVAQTPSLISAR